MNERNLKLGILLDSYEVPAWAYSALERITNSDYAEISLIILNDNNDAYKSKFDKLWKNKDKIVYRIFNKIDEKMDHRQPNAFKPKNLREILSDVPTLKVKPVQKGYSDYFEPLDIHKIREYELDVLIRVGFRILRGDILTAAKYGIWSYHHGDNRINRGGPPGFWEVVESWPETGSILQVLGEDLGASKVLYGSSSFTHDFSPARNRSYCFWASSSFLGRQITLLYRLGEKKFLREIENFNQDLNFYDHRQYKTPSNILMLNLIAKLFGRIILRIYQKTFYLDQWHLIFDLHKDISTSFCKFKTLFPPKDRFWADPHVIQADGRYYIFVEEYIYKKRKGQISVIEMDRQGNCKDTVRVLERDYHLSYPFVFEWEGKYFMVPESAQNKTIDLYECIEFPYEWKFKMNLMKNVNAVDTTLFHYCGKWWLFTGMAENEGSLPLVELFLFSSNVLFTSEWNPHPLNPIVSDVKRARPAGRLFTRNGKIFRPSQDCSKFYGYGFDLNEILLLSETEYSEKEVISVRPNWDKKIQATHTFTSDGQLTIVDAFMRRRKLF